MKERETELMRVPKKFKFEISKIARRQNKPMTRFLDEDGVRIIKNARRLTNILFGPK